MLVIKRHFYEAHCKVKLSDFVCVFYSRGKDQAAKDIAGRYPISHYWDSHDPKLVVCEAHILPKAELKDDKVKPRASLTKAIEEGPVSTYRRTLTN